MRPKEDKSCNKIRTGNVLKALKACGTNGTSLQADLSLHLVLPNATENPCLYNCDFPTPIKWIKSIV